MKTYLGERLKQSEQKRERVALRKERDELQARLKDVRQRLTKLDELARC